MKTVAERLAAQMKFWTPEAQTVLGPFVPQIAEAERLVGGGMEWAVEEVARLAARMGRANPWTESK